MTATAMICELNPLHNGHQYLMAEAGRSSEGSPLIALMSGHYVQRGEPSVFNKWARAKAALLCGADLVLELPSLYAASSAEYFATGAVAILNTLGCVDRLVFGVEADKYEAVEAYAAERMRDEKAFYDRAKAGMINGTSYCHAAAISENPGSNNILAAEYLCALKRSGSTIRPIPIPRCGSDSHIQTASAIRKALFTDGTVSTIHIPAPAVRIFEKEIRDGRGPVTAAFFENHILSLLRAGAEDSLSGLPFISEGLEHKLTKEARRCGTLEQLTDACTSRRYPRGRIKRILTALMTGVRADQLERFRYTPPYVRALGWNQRGLSLFQSICRQSPMPAFAQCSEGLQRLTGESLRILENEIRATDLYVLGCPDPAMRKGCIELTQKVITV